MHALCKPAYLLAVEVVPSDEIDVGLADRLAQIDDSTCIFIRPARLVEILRDPCEDMGPARVPDAILLERYVSEGPTRRSLLINPIGWKLGFEAVLPRPPEEDAHLLVELPARRVVDVAVDAALDVATREGPMLFLFFRAPDIKKLDLLLRRVHKHWHHHDALREGHLIPRAVCLHDPVRLRRGHEVVVSGPYGGIVCLFHAKEYLDPPLAMEGQVPQ
mmetsp:Transcript_54513/g.151989  ORF Transcript_54513/g.151989 Transcript_54513/m.151989 type:complete len:218 (-) Transcript_54513:361-1014(-)